MIGPRELVTIWQQQPAGDAERWAQVLGETFAPGPNGGGPLRPEDQPEVEVILTTGSVRLSRAEVVRLVDALGVWLGRTRWTAELPAAPEGYEL